MTASLRELFDRARTLGAAEREALLAGVEAGNPGLGARLRRMLDAAHEDTSPLDVLPWEALGSEPPSVPPERIGPYRLIREVGRGGMGAVYLAEEETPDFRRTVALKLIERPGFDAAATRRFREEIRILSALEHPGIARFLDGGRAPDGTFFLALEYVEGEDILTWSENRELDLRQRLELFLQGLEAVAFAHRLGVVHRDLKPGHLLVGRDGRPRLLDFGISKLVDPGAAHAAATRTEMRALTPVYASPEQFRGESATPASDVYSLGVVLYELLSGRRPFGSASSFAALAQAVLETDPEPPSSAARRTATEARPAPAPGTTGAGRTPTTGPTRPVPAGAGSRALGRDLDAICLLALRKAPHERYPDAGAFADDLRRALEGRSVVARRGGVRYRLGRFLGRNRRAAVVALAIVLAAGAGLLAWRASREARELAPSEPPPRPFPFVGVGAAEEHERAFAADPTSVPAGVFLVLAYIRTQRFDEAEAVVAKLRALPGQAQDASIDYVEAYIADEREEPQRSLVLYTAAIEHAIAQGRGDLVAHLRSSRGRILSNLGRREEAMTDMLLARRDFEIAGDLRSLAKVLNDLAIEEMQQGHLDRGEALLVQSLDAAKRSGRSPVSTLLNLADLALYRGRPDLAEQRSREAVEIARAGTNRRIVADAIGELGDSLAAQGRRSEAAEALDESIALLRETGELTSLKHFLSARAQLDLAAARFDDLPAQIRELERATDSGDFVGVAMAAIVEGRIAAARGDLDRMRSRLATARRLMIENGDLEKAADIDAFEARAELAEGNRASAGRLAGEALARLPASAAEGDPHFFAVAILAQLAAEERRFDDARARLASLGDGAASPAIERRLAYLSARAAVARAEGRTPEARADLAAAIAAAASAEHRLAELGLRLELAELEIAAGDRVAGRSAARDVAAAARPELGGLLRRAARLAG